MQCGIPSIFYRASKGEGSLLGLSLAIEKSRSLEPGHYFERPNRNEDGFLKIIHTTLG